MNSKRSLAFTVELIGLFILLIAVIVIVTQSFVASRSESLKARYLTDAVTLAESVAEAASSSDSINEIADVMMGTTGVRRAEGEDPLVIYVDFENSTEAYDDYVVLLTRTTLDKGSAGVYAEDIIDVFKGDESIFTETEEPAAVYSLTTGHFFSSNTDKASRSTDTESDAGTGDETEAVG